jgi:hypothetical protein
LGLPAQRNKAGLPDFPWTATASAPMKRSILIVIVLGLIFVAGILGYGALTGEQLHSTPVENGQGDVATHH